MSDLLNTIPMLRTTITKLSSDMRFVGLFFIIIGVLYSLTIIGAIMGIPLIISGLRLRESSDSFTSYMVSGDNNMLERALERQSRFFFIQKIFIIITLVLMVLYVIAIIVLIVTILPYFEQSIPYSV
ncbi:MAG: hypothetical protein HXY50_06295 [Ignavibacteriaceae bacterium]|nr:hypothetical protein [Ignavibacteriaceae bacterium]